VNVFLYPHLEIDSGGRLRMKVCDTKYVFNFLIVNFPFKYVATFQQHPHIEYTSLS